MICFFINSVLGNQSLMLQNFIWTFLNISGKSALILHDDIWILTWIGVNF